jgi:hypothetical protein
LPFPPTYQRQHGYADFTIANPGVPHLGQDLDQDFDEIATVLGATQARLQLVQRDDGALANAIVTRDSISPTFLDELIAEASSASGTQGPAGPPGDGGPAGEPGPTGPPLPWIASIGVPSTNIGTFQQLYLNVDNGDVYQKAISGNWLYAGNIRGPASAGGGGGVSDHGQLLGLADPDHPIAAVQGLQSALDNLTTAVTTTAAQQNRVFFQPAPPTANLNAGDLWFDSDDGNRQYRWSGTAWVDVADSRILSAAASAAAAIAAASSAQATADGKVTTFFQPTVPANPGIGDLWIRTDQGNRLFRWNGTTWLAANDAQLNQAILAAADAQATADGKIETFFQPSPPVGASLGDLWVDTDDNNHMYRFNGATWQSVRDAGISAAASAAAAALAAASTAQAIADGKIEVFYQSGPPVGASLGDLWIDTDDRQLYRYNGASWQSMQDAALQTALNAAALAQDTADGKITAFYQATAPTAGQSPQTGDLWYDTDDGNHPYRYNGASWVSVRDAAATDALNAANTALANAATAIAAASSAQATADGKIEVYRQGNPPTGQGESEGDLWIDSDDNQLYRYQTGSWVSMRDTAIATALSNASSALGTANTKATIFLQPTPPAGANVGDLWVDNDDQNRPYRFNGATWVDLIPIAGVTNGQVTSLGIANGAVIAAKINVGQLSAISADMGTITAGLINLVSGAWRLELGIDDTYIQWFGTGVKNDANARFYVKTNGDAFFAGTLASNTVDTPNLVPDALSDFDDNNATGTFNNTGWTTRATLTYTPDDANSTLLALVSGTVILGDAAPVNTFAQVRITRNGTVVRGPILVSRSRALPIPFALHFMVSGLTGAQVFNIEYQASASAGLGDPHSVENSNLTIIELKR